MDTQRFLPGVQFTWQGKIYEVKKLLSEDKITIEDVDDGDRQIASSSTLTYAFSNGQLALTAENVNTIKASPVFFEVDHTVIDMYFNEKSIPSHSANLGVIERQFIASNKSLKGNVPPKLIAFIDPFSRRILLCSFEIEGAV